MSKSNERYALKATATRNREERIAAIVHGMVFEHKKLVEIAADLNMTPHALSMWKYYHRDEVESAITEAIAEVKQVRAGAALTLRAGMSEKVDRALETFDKILDGNAGIAADATVKLKAAVKIVDYVDPPTKGGNTVNLNVFSEKSASLLRALNDEDLTPRKPLPRGRVIDAEEAEIVEEGEEE
jgi:hypothetical protein